MITASRITQAKCRADLLIGADKNAILQFHDGSVATSLEYHEGIAGSGTRRVAHLKHQDGSARLYREIYEVSFKNEVAAIAALGKNDLLNYFDKKFKQGESLGGPKYYGLELVKIGPDKWHYFAAMEDLSVDGKYFTLKGIEFIRNQSVRTQASTMIHDHPEILKKVCEDLVTDVNRGVARIDPDFILRQDGRHWFDTDMWKTGYLPADARRISAESIVRIYDRLSQGLQSKEIILEFAATLRSELKKLLPTDRKLFLESLREQLNEISWKTPVRTAHPISTKTFSKT